ncbi:DUF6002 family protein [Dactylosporangium sp. CA-139114]|uniref:DUF6002 family protein n=1 Tax=Dactylosporangium sp. CA-139114 TaxID=3239931 RepID=UPI003D982B2B
MTIMTMSATTLDQRRSTSRNVLLDHYDELPEIIRAAGANPAPVTEPEAFSPGFQFPQLDAATRRFLEVAEVAWTPLPDYRDRQVRLLDLMRNPGTNTTKTLASLLIVARAVEFIRRTGESIVIFSPTSANKGTALRDAVWRAIDAGLVTAEQLRVVILAPRSCLDKQRRSPLSDDERLRALNPLLILDGDEPEQVKVLGRKFVAAHASEFRRRHGAHLWFSLELTNYLIADATRAFFEQEISPSTGRRLHAHAVSSAFGLLGYNLGRDVLESRGAASVADRPGFLLVQHLGTPDMVLNLRFGSFDRRNMPTYRLEHGLHRQDSDPHFPWVTHDPNEILDPTFYTHRPPTSPAMNDLIAQHGGTGIVVSLHECLERLPLLRTWLPQLPADPRTLREWSLVMALTGLLNAVDRDLIDDRDELVVHGSGTYSPADFATLEPGRTVQVTNVEDMEKSLLIE